MKRLSALIALIGLVSLLGATGCAPEKYRLSGEFSEEGATVRTESVFAIDAAETILETPIGDMTGMMSMDQRSVNEVTILEATGGEPTKLRRAIETDSTTTELEIMGQRQKDEEESPLEGETIVMTFADGKWTSELEAGTPTKAQQEALVDAASDLFMLMFPEQELEIGEQWTVPQEALAPVVPADAENVEGSMTCTLAAIEEYAGEQCAVVDYSLEASFDDNSTKGQKMSGKITLTGKVYRSLDSHVDLLWEGKGTMSFTGTFSEDGQSLAFSATGPVTVKETSAIVE